MTNTTTITVLGNPVKIETNLQSRSVTITLPLPTDVTAEKMVSILVYIQHSNGTTEVKRGRVVELEPGIKGIEFEVAHFSTFTLLYSPDLKIEEEVNTLAPIS